MKDTMFNRSPSAAVKGEASFADLRLAAFLPLISSVLIIVTGSVVRVTGSGLGCDNWPMCTDETLAPTAEMGIHGVIEFVNRLLTFVLCAAVGWMMLVARRYRRAAPRVMQWAWAQLAIILLNAVIGGITVWMRLSPYIVAAHFLAAMLLIVTTTVTWHQVQALTQTPAQASLQSQRLARVSLAAAGVTVFAGVLVAGTGPHAGDSADIPRMPFDWTTVTVIHGIAATVFTVLAVLVCIRARQQNEHLLYRRSLTLCGVLALQMVVGVTQSVIGLPEGLVVVHLLLAAVTWIGAIRVYLEARSGQEARSEDIRAETPTDETAR